MNQEEKSGQPLGNAAPSPDAELPVDRQIGQEHRKRNDDRSSDPTAEETPSGEDEEGGKPAPDDQTLKENREKLGVNEEHKTPEMEKGERGTFP